MQSPTRDGADPLRDRLAVHTTTGPKSPWTRIKLSQCSVHQYEAEAGFKHTTKLDSELWGRSTWEPQSILWRWLMVQYSLVPAAFLALALVARWAYNSRLCDVSLLHGHARPAVRAH